MESERRMSLVKRRYLGSVNTDQSRNHIDELRWYEFKLKANICYCWSTYTEVLFLGACARPVVRRRIAQYSNEH
jgi:hypothetical protein